MKQYRFLTILCVAALASCGDFDDDGTLGGKHDLTAGTPVEVGVSLRVAGGQAADGSETPLSRAPLDTEEDVIYNVWAFQFNGTDDDAVLVCEPFYVDDEAMAKAGTNPVPMSLIASGSATHRLVFAANLNNKAYDWKMRPGHSTYADLKASWINLSNEALTHGADRKNLVMSGSVSAVIAAGTPIGSVTLTRSLACVELVLSIEPTQAAGFKVVSVQLRDVSRRFDVFDAQLDISGNYPSSPSLFDYKAVVDADAGLVSATDPGPKTFRWFVPRNARGTAPGSTSAATKNAHAIKNATYFEIVAVNALGVSVLYRVYPGANDVDDFNLIPNHKYTSTLRITGDGGEGSTDTRIERYPNTVFRGLSNSYLLNPPPANTPAREFTIPIKQVNRYWLPSWDGYGGMGGKRIGDSDAWTVYLLWQDASDIVRETSANDYNADKHVVITKPTGTGGGDYTSDVINPDACFKVRVPAGATHGNFVVVVRKDDPGDQAILWSWHLWVTDYNPAQPVPITKDKFIYPVKGGQVERYYGTRFGYPGDDSRTWDGTTWSPTVTTTATLAQSVVMDRYIGALNANYNAQNVRTNLYYQFGRKDPFPGNIKLYKIDGTEITASNGDFSEQLWAASNANMVSTPALSGNSQITASIANPMRFYGNQTWVGVSSTSYGWNDSQSLTPVTYPTKSIYDPCPEGWRIAATGSINDFRHNNTVNNAGRGLAWSSGARYYPYIENDEDYTASEYAFYAAAGHRQNTNGGFGSGGANAHVWSPFPNNSANGRYLVVTSGSYNTAGSASRSYGFSIRCASE